MIDSGAFFHFTPHKEWFCKYYNGDDVFLGDDRKARIICCGKVKLKLQGGMVLGIDFGDIFSLVVKVTSIKLLVSVATAFDFKVEQMDMKISFLHGKLEKEIYVKQHEGFAVKGKKELVYKLKKSLCGLKKLPRMWYQKHDTFIQGLGFTRSKADHCVHFKLIGDHVISLVLYVDDMFLVRNEK